MDKVRHDLRPQQVPDRPSPARGFPIALDASEFTFPPNTSSGTGPSVWALPPQLVE
jgi:hypothetical protein